MGDKELKGWKIDIRSYDNTSLPDGKCDVQENLAAMLFHSELKLGPEEMFKAKDLADRIRASISSVTLDKTEYARIKKSFGHLTSLPEGFIEFLMRIRDAEEVPLKEA